MYTVYVALDLKEWERRIVEETLSREARIVYKSGKGFAGIEEADVAIAFILPRDAAQAAGRLKFVQVPAAGADNLDLEYLFERGVKVATSKGCNARAVAEHAFALILALAKRVVEQDGEVKRGLWRSFTEENFLADLDGSTVTIVGYGNIGREVARIAKAFNMRVLAVKKNPEKDSLADEVYPVERLAEALSQADFVVLALPLTRETYRLIGEKELKSMKKTAYLVNVGRGAVVDEEALYRALSEGWIAGAGIDVWWRYPPDKDYPSPLGVHRLPNVVATPHKAGWTRKARENCLRFACENVLRFVRGEEPLNLLEPSKAY